MDIYIMLFIIGILLMALIAVLIAYPTFFYHPEKSPRIRKSKTRG